jgi:hypothetical protein
VPCQFILTLFQGLYDVLLISCSAKSSRRFGNLLFGNSVEIGTSEYESDHELSQLNCFENSISSSDKVWSTLCFVVFCLFLFLLFV